MLGEEDEHDYREKESNEEANQQETILESEKNDDSPVSVETTPVKVENKEDASSSDKSEAAEQGASQQGDTTPKLVKPGAAIVSERNGAAAKEFKPKSGPSFLRRLRKPPIDVPTESA